MKQIINCFEENNPAINKIAEKVSVREGKKIVTELFQVLNYRKDAIGLSATQLGINAAVAVVNVKTPIYLINPYIVKQWDKIIHKESCLSYPNKTVYTTRYKYCIVKDDGYKGQYYFGPEFKPDHETMVDGGDELGLLESICVQHEISHLQGKTIFDIEVQRTPLKTEIEIGRNEKVKVKNNITGEIITIKYKKIMNDLGENKKWTLLITNGLNLRK